MTNRFECDKGSRIIIDNETKLHYIMTLDWECILVTKLLNRFADENEQLKAICKDHRDHAIDFKADCVRLEKENEELQQFKDKVFELLHKKLEEYPYLTLTEKWDNDCKYKHSCRENHERNVAYARMNDVECLEIQMSALAYLLRCVFDDLAMAAYETSNALQHLRKELQE